MGGVSGNGEEAGSSVGLEDGKTRESALSSDIGTVKGSVDSSGEDSSSTES